MKRATLCNECARRTCLETGVPCPQVESLLPSADSGRNKREWTGIAHAERLPDGPSRAALREAGEGKRELMRLANSYRDLLTRREHLAAVLVWGLGCSLKEAAARLGVSISSVRVYVRRTLVKMYDVVLQMRREDHAAVDSECRRNIGGKSV